jgi:hypothetical protein
MPGMDGVEFVRRLVDIPYSGAVVLVSGEGERILDTVERLARAHRLNVLGHLNKPVQIEMLEALIEIWRDNVPKSADKVPHSYGAEEVWCAIAGGELVNYYQPKVDVVNGHVVGVETLVRWRHPDDGLVFPDQFISVPMQYMVPRLCAATPSPNSTARVNSSTALGSLRSTPSPS